ncbi:glycine betaine ABC transporter substrate-binding protein [Lactobacillus corticis]|uniref:Glycine betaine/carnitine/choline ABC transporter substrate-binding protein n=1 Tax=Lactobacillus corticis TaxID=2201249 RepID=A0A916VI13_9LACO|nr:glycine betaine ABC transporter substrate-binding protein [Lactobacillus corticis]GFZ27676.1 glycine betaine/carnitine/choline ABC transporter substrate-binding protein [Lactobacillus corticis]
MTVKKKWSLFGLIIGLIIAIAVTHWSNQKSAKQASDNNIQITIGSKDFTESKIVMQIWAVALAREGYKIKTKPNISSSVIYQAIKTGQVDLYPEYTGTIAMNYLKADLSGKSSQEIAAIAKKGMRKVGLTVLKAAPANDSQGIVIKTSLAKKYGIYTLGDLQKKADKVRFITQGEFNKRSDGLPGLATVYGKFRFKSSRIYDAGLKYQIMANNEGDAAPVSTTEGQLVSKDYLVLKDEKHFWPAYNLVPLANSSILNKNPKIAKILNQIDQKLTTEVLRKLNKKVDVDGQDYQTVAQDWVRENVRK